VKVTGGPDGDVAGNLMKILFREYGDNAKIVGVADGFGVAEDPEGLDHEELLRLVHQSEPITSFNPGKLSSKGILLDVNSEDGVARRNSMHFRVKADAFVPAGGRPSTINSDNYKKFFDDDGVPSSKLVVEGANIFITEDAREKLFREGNVQIVKDSSANKCGVITSSCEVAASMLLSKEEFMAVKPELVDDVLVKLRHLAKLEAELLFREYRNYPGSLPDFAKRISSAINRVRDDVTLALEKVEPSDPLFQELRPLIAENLPKKLVEVAGDRIYDRFPVQYQRNAIASALACNLVYNEGIHLIEVQPNDTIHGRPIEQVIASRAIEYHREHKRIKELVAKMRKIKDENDSLTKGNLDPAEEERIMHIVAKGGARTNLDIF
jgi:glutamate dehydrogenase